MKQARRSEQVQSLARGLSVIKAFGSARPQLTLSEVARATGLTRATARRFLLTLADLGYVSSDGRYFRLEPRVLELGYAFLASIPWWRPAQRIVDRLADEIDCPVAAGALDGDAAVYLAHARPKRLEEFARAVGTRLPASVSAMGRVLLAHLPASELDAQLAKVKLRRLTPLTIVDRRRLRAALADVRALGYALVDQELEMGLVSLAVPIVGRSGSITAAIGMSVTDPRFDAKTVVRRYLAPLGRAANQIAVE